MNEFQDDIILDYNFNPPVYPQQDENTFMGYVNNHLSSVRIQTDQLLRALPRYSEAKNCCPEDIVQTRLLGTRDFFRQHFHGHLRHISPTREILKHMKKRQQYFMSDDLAPDTLLRDPFIAEKLTHMNGPTCRDQVALHARGTSEILWKGAFLYPIVHNLMQQHPVDAIDYFNEISLEERKERHHVNLMDRVFVRYAIERMVREADIRMVKAHSQTT